MRITLKKLSVNQRLSEETLCYSADLYIDGRYAGHVANRGCGGSDEQHLESWVPKNINELVTANYPDVGTFEPLDSLCQRLASLDSEVKRFKRIMKTRVVVIDGGTIREFSWKGCKEVTPTMIQAVKGKGFSVIMNEMNDEALIEFLEKAV